MEPVSKPAGTRASPSAVIVPQAHGGALLRGGVPGNAGGRNGGRPSDEFKRRMRELASSDDAMKYLDQCVRGVHGPKVAISAQQYAADRGYGRVPQLTNVEGAAEPLTIRLVRE